MINIRRHLDAMLDRRLPPVTCNGLSMETRIELCRLHGDFSLAYSTAVQPKLQYFGDEHGYIAFARKMGHIFALGDPVAPKSEHGAYIQRFIADTANPCFVQIGRETAGILSRLGYLVNHMGIDSHLALATHSFAGKRYESVRYSEKWLWKKNYRIVECDGGVTDPAQIRALSDDWRAGRIVRRREMSFLNRPFTAGLSPHMRRFVIIDSGDMPLAILDFDPLCRGGETIGYTAVFKRKMPGATSHAEIGLTKFATDRFREEGRAVVTLGLSPLAAIAKSGFAESALWKTLFHHAYQSERINRKIFNLQGQAAFKRRFHGEEHATYIAFRRGTPLQMIALLRLLKTL